VALFSPMPLGQRREPFDHPDWFFELKYDGFRALAYVHGGGAKLVSRRNLPYRRFDDLASQLSLEVNADDAVLDGEIVKLDDAGRPIFLDLMRRRGPFCFVAFDLLASMVEMCAISRSWFENGYSAKSYRKNRAPFYSRSISPGADVNFSPPSASRISKGLSPSGRTRPTTPLHCRYRGSR
jgi:ATP dependent DNA ligase domain